MTICNCGGIESMNGHLLGHPECFRRPLAGNEIPAQAVDGKWIVPGHGLCDDFTLFQTRGYARHTDGTWSKRKNDDETVSLHGDW